MWFKRKAANRRLARDHVLDVKLRSSQVRAARVRLGVTMLGGFLAAALGAYLLWRAGGWALDCLVYDNNRFAIQEIELQTDGVIAIEQLRRWAGVKTGQNLLALDLGRVKRDLELVSVVQSVSLERVLPNMLRIDVTEREPVAQINVPRPGAAGGVEIAVYQIDPGGWVMVPLDSRHRAVPLNQPNELLPIITGLKASELLPGRQLKAPQVQAALQLVVAFDRCAMASLVELSRIDVSAPEVLLVTTGQGSLITFGLTDVEQQLRRWHEIAEMGRRMSKALASLDLAVSNNVPARWLEASALPPVFPKPPRTLRTNRKHV